MHHFNKSIKYLQGIEEVYKSRKFKYLIAKKVNSFFRQHFLNRICVIISFLYTILYYALIHKSYIN